MQVYLSSYRVAPLIQPLHQCGASALPSHLFDSCVSGWRRAVWRPVATPPVWGASSSGRPARWRPLQLRPVAGAGHEHYVTGHHTHAWESVGHSGG